MTSNHALQAPPPRHSPRDLLRAGLALVGGFTGRGTPRSLRSLGAPERER